MWLHFAEIDDFDGYDDGDDDDGDYDDVYTTTVKRRDQRSMHILAELVFCAR